MASRVRMGGTAELQQRVRQIARRARRLVRLHGAGWFVTLVVLAALGLGCSDYWLRYEDPGVRMISSLVLGLVVLWSAYRCLWGAWRYRCTDLHAARRIEARFPALGEVVSSAVAFSAQAAEDETAGSSELRRVVVAQASAALEPLDCDACLDRRRPLGAAALAGAALAAVLALTLADPAAVGLASRRLVQPWGAAAWPRRHQLVLTSAPTQVAVGQDLEVEVQDAGGRLPDVVQIHYWFDGDDASSVETHTMQPLGDRLIHRLPHVTRPLRYRATGGDDQQMAWHELRVVEPPRVVTCDLHLTPPAYTGLPPHDATGDFRALQGTEVTVRLRVNKPLVAADLDTTTIDVPNALLPLRLDEDRLGCALAADATWTVLQSGSYGFRFVDDDDLESGTQERWNVTVIPDQRPVVTLRQPATDLQLTPGATVTLEAQVTDDLAIRAVALDYHTVRGGVSGDPQRVELWSGPPQASPATAPQADDADGVRRDVSYEWDLSQIPGLEPGTEFEYCLVAEDYRPQEGVSTTRRITIISSEEHSERVTQRQAEILAQIAEVARMQQQNSDQTGQLAAALRDAQRLRRSDIDQLQGAELNQRQVEQRLIHPVDGLVAQVDELLRDFERNRVDHPHMAQELQRLEAALQEVGDTMLTPIQRQLRAALKAAREMVPEDAAEQTAAGDAGAAALAESVAAIQTLQEEVVGALEGWLDELSQWDAFDRLVRDVDRVRRDQEELRRQTDQLRAATLSKDVRELSEELRAQVSRLAEQQLAVARRWDAWSDRLRRADAQMDAAAGPAANPVTAARELLEQAAIGGGMRDAARDVAANRLGQAVDRQGQAVQQLQRVQALLAPQAAPSQDETAARLATLLTEIPALMERQQQLEEQTRALDQAAPDSGTDREESESRRAALAQLAQEQVGVGEAIRDHQRRYADLVSLASVFQSAADAAAEAVRQLRSGDSGPVTWGWQQQVRSELAQVLAVLAEAASARPGEPDALGTAAESASDDGTPRDPTLLLQLKVVRSVQQELHRRTATLEETDDALEQWDVERAQRQQTLARRQDALADVLTRLGAPPTAGTPAARPPVPSAPESAGHGPPPSDASTLDQQLLSDLPPAGAEQSGATRAAPQPPADGAAADDPLHRIAGQMRTVAQRIRGRDAIAPTLVAQRQIIDALTDVVEALAARQAATGGSEPTAQRASAPDRPREDPAAAQGQQAAQDAAGPAAGSPTVDDASVDLPRAAQELWGHLPERYRRRVQNIDAVEFLPAYRTLIEDYYRRLSESRARRP